MLEIKSAQISSGTSQNMLWGIKTWLKSFKTPWQKIIACHGKGPTCGFRALYLKFSNFSSLRKHRQVTYHFKENFMLKQKNIILRFKNDLTKRILQLKLAKTYENSHFSWNFSKFFTPDVFIHLMNYIDFLIHPVTCMEDELI